VLVARCSPQRLHDPVANLNITEPRSKSSLRHPKTCQRSSKAELLKVRLISPITNSKLQTNAAIAGLSTRYITHIAALAHQTHHEKRKHTTNQRDRPLAKSQNARPRPIVTRRGRDAAPADTAQELGGTRARRHPRLLHPRRPRHPARRHLHQQEDQRAPREEGPDLEKKCVGEGDRRVCGCVGGCCAMVGVHRCVHRVAMSIP